MITEAKKIRLIKLSVILIVLSILALTYFYNHRQSLNNKPSVITLSGKIEDNFRFKISVSYSAYKDSFLCKRHAVMPFTYTRSSSRTIEYYPTIEDGKYRIDLPLSEYPPDKGCQYRPVSVSYSIAPEHQEIFYSQNKLLDLPSYNAWNIKYYNWIVARINDYSKSNSKEINLVCGPRPRSVELVNDPEKKWRCIFDPIYGERPTTKFNSFQYDFNPNTSIELILNIRTTSEEEYWKLIWL